MDEFHRAPGGPPGSPYDLPPGGRKRKWAAGLLSFCFPGLGHMYAGAMLRGLFFMLLLIGLIFGVVLVAIEGVVPLIVLLSVMIPVVYFYALFDALQTTERSNAARSVYRPYYGAPSEPFVPPDAPEASRRSVGTNQVAWLILGGGIVIGLTVVRPDWLEALGSDSGALVGAMVLIGAGVVLLISSGGKKR